MMDQEMETAARGGPDGGGNRSTSTSIIPPSADGENPPAELMEMDRWITWRFDPQANGDINKVANAKGETETWGGTYKAAVARAPAPKDGGIGFVFKKDDDLGGVDLDTCRDPMTGELTPWAQEVVDDFASYTEVSPSKTGVKIFARGAPPKLPAHKIPMPGDPINGHRPQIEAYVDKRYFTVTGQRHPGTPAEVREASGAWLRLHKRLAEVACQQTAEGGGRSSLAGEGRDGALLSHARSVLARLDADTSDEDRESAVRRAVEAMNYLGSPLHPNFSDGTLDKRQVDKIIRVALKKQAGGAGGKRPSATAILMELLADQELWHDERGTAYATVEVAGHREHHPVGSRAFREWLARAFYKSEGKTPPKEALTSTLEQAAAQARFDGQRHETWVRVAAGADGQSIYLDLGDEDWRVVEVDQSGWRVLDRDPPVRFRRPGPTQALPMPEHGGDINDLRKLVCLAGDDDLKLLVGCLVTYLRPGFPQPILYAHGEMGSAKTSFLRSVVLMLDPRIPATPGAPASEDDLVVQAQNRWIVPADNVSRVTADMSDAYCRLATGGGLEKRKLYTDEDGHAIDVKRPVVMTGISVGTERPDFLDRTVLIKLGVIDEGNRLLEREVDAAVDEIRPRLIGALLDGAATALANLDATEARLRGKLPRMADFAAWVEAAAPAFGWAQGAFLEAYQAAIDDRLGDAAESDRLVKLISEWLPGCKDGRFEGGASELLEALRGYLKSAGREEALHDTWFPKTGVWLGRLLPNHRRVLKAIGIEYQKIEGSGTKPAAHRLRTALFDDVPF
ncbi:MAG: hypothetical protein IH626_19380 [Rhodospirillales bacterium]|nr:hypothetical protein [Rhodospirillales bacterium]